MLYYYWKYPKIDKKYSKKKYSRYQRIIDRRHRLTTPKSKNDKQI